MLHREKELMVLVLQALLRRLLDRHSISQVRSRNYVLPCVYHSIEPNELHFCLAQLVA